MTNNKKSEKNNEKSTNTLENKDLSAHELFELGEKTDSFPLLKIHGKNKNSETATSED